MHIRNLFVFIVVLASIVSAAEPTRVLSKQDAEMFARIVASRTQSLENAIVCSRMAKEKQTAFKCLLGVLERDHGLKPDASYTYEAEKFSLFEVSTNGVKKGSALERKLVRKFKSSEDAAPLTRLMLARQRSERQLLTLFEMMEESRQDGLRWDEHLRKTFSLVPQTRYRVNKISDEKYELVVVPGQQESPGSKKSGMESKEKK